MAVGQEETMMSVAAITGVRHDRGAERQTTSGIRMNLRGMSHSVFGISRRAASKSSSSPTGRNAIQAEI